MALLKSDIKAGVDPALYLISSGELLVMANKMRKPGLNLNKLSLGSRRLAGSGAIAWTRT